MNIGGALRRCEEDDDDSALPPTPPPRQRPSEMWTAGSPSTTAAVAGLYNESEYNRRRSQRATAGERAREVNRGAAQIEDRRPQRYDKGGHRGKTFGRAGARRFEKGAGAGAAAACDDPDAAADRKNRTRLHSKKSCWRAREATATVKTALNDARKRERRAVELGGALRRRVGDERRADTAETNVMSYGANSRPSRPSATVNRGG